MSFIQNLFTSRDNNADGNTYVGQEGRVWWNPVTNAFYSSDGNTVGGIPVGVNGANANILNLTVSTIGTDDSSAVEFLTTATFDQGATVDVGLTVTGDIAVTGNISAATTTRIGGVRAGPGANISNTGLLTIDTAGLSFSFGNFFASNNILSIVNSDENMVLVTQGNAEIQLVGNIGFYKENGMPPDISNRYFFAKEDGQIFFYVNTVDPNEAAVDIIGTSTGNIVPPGITGSMLQVTGQDGIPCRIYYDGNDSYVSWVARRYNGSASAPTQVLAGEDVLRINATAATNAGVGNVAMAQIEFQALEDQTTTAQGSTINFIVTPVGSPASSRVTVANVTVANGVTATKFTTAGTVSATGNITGGNVTTVGIASTGSLTASTTISATGNITGGNILTGGAVSATGGITSGDGISDSKGDVRSIPLNTQNTGYTLVATDAGKLVNMTTGNVTVPASVFATPFGQAITIYNNQNSSNAIVQGSGVTIRLAGTAATGNRTLSRYSLATLVCVSANTFVISGAGLT